MPLYTPLIKMHEMEANIVTESVKRKPPRLYVQGLPVGTTEVELEELFGQIGETNFASVVPPKKEDQRTTYGFVSYESIDDAQLAIDTFHEYQFGPNVLRVTFSKETQKEFGIEVDEDDEDDFYDKLYEDISYTPPDEKKSIACDISGDRILEDGISESNGHIHSNGTEKNAYFDAVRGMMFKDLPVKPFPDELVFNIVTTEVDSPYCFYSQLLNEETAVSLKELSTLLSHYESYNKQMAPFSPKINELCVVKVGEDQLWYRAILLNYNADKTAKVFFVDYGNKANVNTEDIRCINERLLNFPRYAMKFSIDGVIETSSDSEKTELTKSLLLYKPASATCISIEGDLMKCDVVTDGGEQLSTALSAISSTKEDSRTMFANLPSQVIISSIEFEAAVVCVNSPSDVSCWVGDLLDIKERVEQFTAILSQKLSLGDVNYTPVVGEVCAGFHEEYEEWYRVHILELLPNNMASAKLIDYGNKIEIKCQHLAAFPDETFCTSPEAVSICLDGVNDECDESTISLLKEKLEMQKIVCTAIKYTDRYVVRKMLTMDGEDIFTIIKAQQPMVNSDKVDYIKYKMSDIPKFTTEENTFDMIVTCSEGPSLFYGQFADTNVVDSISQQLEELFKVSEPPVGFRPLVNEVYAGFHEEYGQWHRILVNEVVEMNATVLLIDFGDKTLLELKNIRPLPSKVSTFPIQVIACSLHGYSKLSLESGEKFTNLVLSEKVTIKKVLDIDGVLQVQVFKDGDEVDLLTKLCDPEDTRPVRSPTIFTQKPPESAVMCTPSSNMPPISSNKKTSVDCKVDRFTRLPAMVVPNECAVMITYVESPNLIYGQVFDSDVAEKDFNMQVNMNEYCSQLESPHTPSLNELCCGLFENNWYRVFVTKLKENAVDVYFIDYGNYAELTFDKLRLCPKEFVQIPSLAVPFQLHDRHLISERNENTLALKEKLENEICAFKITCRSGKVATAKIFDKNGCDVFQYLEKSDCGKEGKVVPSCDQGSGNIRDNDEKHANESGGTKADDVAEEENGFCLGDDLLNTRDVVSIGEDGILETSVDFNEKFVISSLPTEVHPLEAAEMKMDISIMSSKVQNLLIIHVVSPSLIYCASTEIEIKSKFDEMQTQLSEYCHLHANDECRLKAGLLCACIDLHSKWHRAIVTDVKEADCSVFLLDSGKTLKVPHSSVKLLGKEFKSMPTQAIPIKLMTVRPVNGENTWSNDATDYLRGMIDGQIVRALPKVRLGHITDVKLKLDSNDVLVDKLFEAGGYAEVFKPVIPRNVEVDLIKKVNEVSVPFDSVSRAIPLEKAPGAQSFKGIITCVVSPRLFYARIYDDVKLSRVDNMSEALQSLYRERPVSDEKLSKGDLCATLHKDNQWYRGYIIDTGPKVDGYLVWLVDYGIRGIFTRDRLWPLPDDMKAFPAQAFTMQLHHIVPTKNKDIYPEIAIKRFKTLTVGKIMRIQIKKVHGHINRVIIYDPHTGDDIADELVQTGLATYYYGKGPKSMPEAAKTWSDSEERPVTQKTQNKNTQNQTTQKIRPSGTNRATTEAYSTSNEHYDYELMNGYMQNMNYPGKCEKCASCSCNTRSPNQSIYHSEERMPFYGRNDYLEQGQFYPGRRLFHFDEEYAPHQNRYDSYQKPFVRNMTDAHHFPPNRPGRRPRLFQSTNLSESPHHMGYGGGYHDYSYGSQQEESYHSRHNVMDKSHNRQNGIAKEELASIDLQKFINDRVEMLSDRNKKDGQFNDLTTHPNRTESANEQKGKQKKKKGNKTTRGAGRGRGH